MMNIEKQSFGTTPEGKEVLKYTLSNNQGMEVDIISYGAIITAIRVPDSRNEPGDVVLGFDTLEEYLGDHPYFGAMVGRVCNRVGKSRFELEGRIFHITANEGANQLHGGKNGFDKQVWTTYSHKTPDQISLMLGYESADGEEGYPGSLLVEVEYSLNDKNELGISCRAKTDKPTHVNLTNHSYFNLNSCEGNILGHEMMIAAGSITELDGESIPTGKILLVDSTAYDFRLSTEIGERIDQVEPGYDINYVLDMKQRELTRVAAVHDPESGRSMEVLTTLPGIQLYTSNYVNGIRGKGGKVYEKHSAVCLETQFFPDSPNQPKFPSTVLLPGEEYSAITVYRFSH
ncbi:MAG: galactose-1-epimerase [Bacteroidetes bacterium]|nr:MAG: galactose-1-epimerase [Bacteroidota bacterium]RLD94912.1 MAG: galactose-1-epimerase [Bacteroidota bacterium]